MPGNTIGKLYAAGATVVRQGESGDCMYVIQEGQVEVLIEQAGQTTRLAVRGPGEFIGEMAIFEREARMATVRTLGPARILKVDKKNLLRSIHDDPSLAFHVVETLSRRVRELSREVAELRAGRAAPGSQPASGAAAERDEAPAG